MNNLVVLYTYNFSIHKDMITADDAYNNKQ